MPWMKVKEDGKVKVYKKGEDGKPEGKPLGTFDTAAEADKQIEALHANVPDGKSINPREAFKAKAETMPGDEVVVYFGGEIKDLGGGKIGGYLIRYSQPSGKDADLTEDYFTKDSMIEIPMTNLPIFYAHGKDSKMRKTIIGRGSVKFDDAGAWLEAQLEQRNAYEKAILAMCKAGKLGYSSGALSHMMERQDTGNGKHLIKTWVVGEASLTPIPAEPRNQVLPLKSLFTAPGGVAESAVTETPTLSTHKENTTMDANEVKDMVAAALKAQREADQKEAETKAAALKHDQEVAEAAKAETLKEISAKGLLRQSYHTTDPKKTGDDNDGVQAFKSWLGTGQPNGSLIAPDDLWLSSKSVKGVTDPFASNSGADGAYLVPDPLYQTIQAKRDLASFVRQAPTQVLTTPSDHILVPAENTKATAFVKTAEAASYDKNKPSVEQKDLRLYKYTKEIDIDEEFLMYQGTNFDAWLSNVLGRAEAVTENTMYTTGTGTNEAQGVLTGASAGNTTATTLVLAPGDLTALIGKLGGGYNVMGETGFLMANATKWYLKGLQTTGFFAFINTPNNGPSTNASGPVGEPGFLGYPAFLSDDMPAYGAVGAKAIVYGNWMFYAVGQRPGMMVQRNPYLLMRTGQVALFANIFRGGLVLQSEAFYYTTGL
jgi:HK97 family phage major capsid protein